MGTWGRRPSCECGTCKKCKHRIYMRRYYQSKTMEERRQMRATRDPERVRRDDRARHQRCKNDPDYQHRRRAVAAVNAAIKAGRLTRELCEVCGAEAQAHHDSYDRPLDVRWLCTIHHAAEHMAQAA